MKRLTPLLVLYQIFLVSVIARGTFLSAITEKEIAEHVKEMIDESCGHITNIRILEALPLIIGYRDLPSLD